MTRVRYEFSCLVGIDAVLVEVAGDAVVLDKAAGALYDRLHIEDEDRLRDIHFCPKEPMPQSVADLVLEFADKLDSDQLDDDEQDSWPSLLQPDLLSRAQSFDNAVAAGAPVKIHEYIAVSDDEDDTSNIWTGTVSLPASLAAETWLKDDWLGAVTYSGLVHEIEVHPYLNPDALPDEKAMPDLVLAKLAEVGITDGPVVETMENWKAEMALAELPVPVSSRSQRRL